MDGWREFLVVSILVCNRQWGVFTAHAYALSGCFYGLLAEALELREFLVDSGGQCHGGSKVESSGGGFLYHITLLLAVFWHHQSLKVRGGEFMMHSSIGWILHGEHPLQVIHHLIQDIRYLIVGFRKLKIERIESILTAAGRTAESVRG